MSGAMGNDVTVKQFVRIPIFATPFVAIFAAIWWNDGLVSAVVLFGLVSAAALWVVAVYWVTSE